MLAVALMEEEQVQAQGSQWKRVLALAQAEEERVSLPEFALRWTLFGGKKIAILRRQSRLS